MHSLHFQLNGGFFAFNFKITYSLLSLYQCPVTQKAEHPYLLIWPLLRENQLIFFKKANTYFSETRLTQSNPTFAFTC